MSKITNDGGSTRSGAGFFIAIVYPYSNNGRQSVYLDRFKSCSVDKDENTQTKPTHKQTLASDLSPSSFSDIISGITASPLFTVFCQLSSVTMSSLYHSRLCPVPSSRSFSSDLVSFRTRGGIHYNAYWRRCPGPNLQMSNVDLYSAFW